MHKIFAKPLFLGKKVVFLPQCHSTNDELTAMTRNKRSPEGLVVYTDDQSKGKGQRGNVWISEPGKNVTMSVLLRPQFLRPANQFYLNLVAGLAIVDTLKTLTSKELKLKWPNDVYLNDAKIAGVLLESNLRGQAIEFCVMGIGLNVNQTHFDQLNATSLRMEEGNEIDRLSLMNELLGQIEKHYLKLKSGSQQAILDSYHQMMMWRGEQRRFEANQTEFNGEIIGIDVHGRLAINHSDTNTVEYYGIKDVKFVR